jgi:beta-galactosidase/beta-glucuronidase
MRATGNRAMILEGAWTLATDPANAGKEKKWFEKAAPGAKPAPVPGIIQQVFPTFHGVGWYWLEFQPPRMPGEHERASIRFAAVDYLAEVWLNGQAVGGHENGETPHRARPCTSCPCRSTRHNSGASTTPVYTA